MPHVCNRLDILGVGLYLSLGHHEPQELSRRHDEGALDRVQLHLVATEVIESLCQSTIWSSSRLLMTSMLSMYTCMLRLI